MTKFISMLLLLLVAWAPSKVTDQVSIVQEIADQADPEADIPMTITVKKPDVIKGFAKVNVNLPEGFIAEQVETQGASFTVEDGTAKFIWMSVPSEEQIVLSLKLKAPAGTKGTFEIDGKFSYLVDNERKSAIMKSSSIIVGMAEEMAAAEAAKKIAHVATSRTVEKISDSKYEVAVKVTKKNVKNFAKIIERIPDGWKATPIESSQAVFSFVIQKAKFVWIELPTDSVVQVKYAVERLDAEGDLPGIQGEFSYLHNEETKKLNIETTEMPISTPAADTPENVTAEAVATKPEATAEETVTKEEAQPVAETPVETLQVVSKPAESNTSNPPPTKKKETPPTRKATPSTAGIPSAEQGVRFKIQLAAGHQNVSKDHFQATYQFSEEKVQLENHQGWIKYTIGQYNLYAKAKDRRNVVSSAYSFPGPFVTAYHDGARVTVQEALMISQQKWVQ